MAQRSSAGHYSGPALHLFWQHLNAYYSTTQLNSISFSPTVIELSFNIVNANCTYSENVSGENGVSVVSFKKLEIYNYQLAHLRQLNEEIYDEFDM